MAFLTKGRTRARGAATLAHTIGVANIFANNGLKFACKLPI